MNGEKGYAETEQGEESYMRKKAKKNRERRAENQMQQS